jgi:hypothetical protein
MSNTDTATWAELFPAGRDIFYEGDDPDGFAAHIAERFGFDPRADRGWWDVIEGDGELAPFTAYRFRCPPEHLDAIYGNSTYPLGS